jgi:FKBP12-rapamycin complex-associated protein
MEALEWCHRYKVSGNVRDLNQAWDLYYHVFRRISRQLPQLTSLELQYVSPNLQSCRDLELAIPGSYSPGQPVVRIALIQSSLQVITSKQRPRKLCIKGECVWEDWSHCFRYCYIITYLLIEPLKLPFQN